MSHQDLKIRSLPFPLEAKTAQTSFSALGIAINHGVLFSVNTPFGVWEELCMAQTEAGRQIVHRIDAGWSPEAIAGLLGLDPRKADLREAYYRFPRERNLVDNSLSKKVNLAHL
jgi:hypothetical protein